MHTTKKRDKLYTVIMARKKKPTDIIYKKYKWQKVRRQVLSDDHNECQRCKHEGKYKDLTGLKRYTRATLVHHEFRVDKHPECAFMKYVNGVRNLYSLCDDCHEIEHEYERGFKKNVSENNDELNEEKW